MLRRRSLRLAVLIVGGTALTLVAVMVIPGSQMAPVKVAVAQTGICSDCHNPGRFVGEPALGVGALPGCGSCHPAQQAALLATPNIPHIQVNCVSCHEGADAGANSHQATATATGMGTPPRINFNLEVCEGCHLDYYNTFEIASKGRTYYGGSDGGMQPPAGWNKTIDFPYLNVLNSGHSAVLENYEDRGMRWSFNDIQQSIKPKAEADLLHGGTGAAYYMGITYLNANNQVVNIPAKVGRDRRCPPLRIGSTHATGH